MSDDRPAWCFTRWHEWAGKGRTGSDCRVEVATNSRLDTVQIAVVICGAGMRIDVPRDEARALLMQVIDAIDAEDKAR